MQTLFTKRIFTCRSFAKNMFTMLLLLPRIISAKVSKRVPKSLQEKLLLSTTSVNQCVLCARFASEMALAEGVDRSEVLSILNMDLSETQRCSDYEMIALLFAQNYAETDGCPGADISARLYAFYGKRIAGDIAVLTKRDHMYNLTGNTFSAFISRLKGSKALHSCLMFEIIFVLLTSPVIVPSWIYVYFKKNGFLFQR